MACQQDPCGVVRSLIKRVGLARALALDPELLFLDEPTAGLDPDRSESLVNLIENLRREANLTIVMVTQDLDTLVALSIEWPCWRSGVSLHLGPFNEVVHLDHHLHAISLQGGGERHARCDAPSQTKGLTKDGESRPRAGSRLFTIAFGLLLAVAAYWFAGEHAAEDTYVLVSKFPYPD